MRQDPPVPSHARVAKREGPWYRQEVKVAELIKGAVRRAFRSAGLEVVRRRKTPHPLAFLAAHEIRTVLDIGANRGQFAREALQLFPMATVHSFEPLPHIFRDLKAESQRSPNWIAHEVALGDADGVARMNVNEFSAASSLLELTSTTTEAFPHTARTTTADVRVQRLDDWVATQELPDNLFVKLDVQGFEDRVIRGGESTLSRAAAMLMEVSFARLYADQLLFDELHERARQLGFRCVGVLGETSDPRTGRLLYGDAIYLDRRFTL